MMIEQLAFGGNDPGTDFDPEISGLPDRDMSPEEVIYWVKGQLDILQGKDIHHLRGRLDIEFALIEQNRLHAEQYPMTHYAHKMLTEELSLMINWQKLLLITRPRSLN